MTIFALLDSEHNLLRYQELDERPLDPSGKGWRWLPVVEDEIPEYDPSISSVVRAEEVDGDSYHITYTVNYIDLDSIRRKVMDNIKAKAQQKIMNLFNPSTNTMESLMVKELNMIARGVELSNKKALGTSSVDEEIELYSINQTWDSVKDIRLKSNEKEEEALELSLEDLLSYDYEANW